jgi:MinD-like ATPase involved in chromosome partitioning or flagellar assembly
MFVSTFYSYKGGVGRTFALVNVAVDLAKSGRSVLLVDFDLEAPGLDTFTQLENKEDVGGIVQFVTDYIDRKSPPNVSDYIFEAPIIASDGSRLPGKVWVMPAGRRDSSYDKLLSKIHWQQLYSDMEGYFLFEDLKRQWETLYSPDYVLIDSRTGHTDVGGICTRQLADLVVLLFTPNEQNLKGLPPIVDAIRQESEKGQGRSIETCFVASNVPTLDDEEGILRRLMSKFSKALSKERHRDRILTIQRYESLQLLNQDIFTLMRPKSRLAKQYREISQFIIERNIEDRAGVLEYLKHLVHGERSYTAIREQNGRLALILDRYSNDSEILLWLARCHTYRSSPNEAISLLEKAESALQTDESEIKAAVHLELADGFLRNREVEIAIKHLESAAGLSGLGAVEMMKLFDLWRASGASPTVKFAECLRRSSMSADEYESLLSRASGQRDWQKFVADSLINDLSYLIEKNPDLNQALLFSLMGTSKFELLPQVSKQLLEEDSQSLANRFNFAMAAWAYNGQPSAKDFAKCIEVLSDANERSDANFHQCLSLTFAVLGDLGRALEHLESAFEKNRRLPVSKFSCWRYQEASQEDFEQDLNEIRSFLKTGEPQPLFLRIRIR